MSMPEPPFKHELNSERTEVTLEIDGKAFFLLCCRLMPESRRDSSFEPEPSR